MKSEFICILLARGGSKGLKGKNLLELGGKPLVQRALDVAIASKVFSKVILSSDDSKILAAGAKTLALIHKRSKLNSNDRSTSEDSICEVLADYGIEQGTCCLMQCTTPFISTGDLKEIARLASQNPLSTIVSGYVEDPHHWSLFENLKYLEPVFDVSKTREPRQTNKMKIFVENGGVYVFAIPEFLVRRNRFMDTIVPHVMPKSRSVDIDTIEDLDLARFYYGSNNSCDT